MRGSLSIFLFSNCYQPSRTPPSLMSDEYTAVIMILRTYSCMHNGLAPSERREYGVLQGWMEDPWIQRQKHKSIFMRCHWINSQMIRLLRQNFLWRSNISGLRELKSRWRRSSEFQNSGSATVEARSLWSVLDFELSLCSETSDQIALLISDETLKTGTWIQVLM